MKGGVKNKLHRRRRRGIFLDIQPPTERLGESVVSGPRSGVEGLDRAQRDDDSMGLHLPVTSCVVKHFQLAKPCGLYWQPGFYLRRKAYGFMGLSEGAYSARRDSMPRGRASLALSQRLSLEPEGLKAFTNLDSKSGPFRFGAHLSDEIRRLGVSSVPDRSELLSSTELRSARPVCALRSNGPSRARRRAESDENRPA
jgi:hypothetical protein